MAWGSKTDSTKSSVTSTEQATGLLTLNPGELMHVQIDADPPASPTDDLTVNVYGTLDAASPVYDATPIFSFDIDKDAHASDNAASFILSGLYGFKIGVQAAGASTTYTEVKISYRKDGVSI